MPPFMPDAAETLAADLRAQLDAAAEVSAQPDLCARYRPAALPGIAPHLVLKPSSLQDIAAAVAWAYARRIPIVPRGLSTTVQGEATPSAGGLLIDLAPFNQIGPIAIDTDAGTDTITVAAGATWGDLETRLAAQGFTLYTYPASRFSTVGGWVASGGLGINAFAYGHLRRWVVSLNLVTSTGETRVLTPRDKAFDACFGAEGQMGVVAEVTLRVRPAPRFTRANLFYFDSAPDQLRFIQHLIAGQTHLAHLQLYNAGYVANLNRLYTEAHPGRPPFYAEQPAALVHVESEAQQHALEDALAHADFLVEEAPPYAAAALWHRRFYPLAAKRYGPDLLAAPCIVPLPAAAAFLDAVTEIAAHFGLPPSIATLVAPPTPGEGEGDVYTALVVPYFLCDTRSRAYPLYRLMRHLVTRTAAWHGGGPYTVGLVNTPFEQAHASGQQRAHQMHRRAADPERLFNPRHFTGIRSMLFHPALSLAQAGASQLGQVARLLQRQTQAPVTPPRLNKTDTLSDAELAATVRACTGCGNCIAVCPAFLLTRDEASTARAKLQIGEQLLAGGSVDRARSDTMFLCTYCGACQDVCETELPLLAAYASIEAKLSAQHARPDDAIAEFIAEVESNTAYQRSAGLVPLLPADAAMPSEPASPIPPRRAPIGPHSVLRSRHCINCGRCAQVCAHGVHARSADDPRRMAPPVSHRCVACLRCVQQCPARALTVAPSSTYTNLGRGIYTPDTVLHLTRQASGGAVPRSNRYDAYRWLDVNPVVHPTLSTAEVEPGVTLGRRLERLQFGPGGLTSVLPPAVDLGLPLILALPPGAPLELNGALVQAAQTLGVLALVDWDGSPDATPTAHTAHTALRFPAGRLDEVKATGAMEAIAAAGLLVVDDLAKIIPYLRTRHAQLALATEIPLDRHAPDEALRWVSVGADVLILNGSDGLHGTGTGTGTGDNFAHLSAVHRALTGAARRDRVSLVMRGGVALAAHMMQALLLGADAVMIDWPLLIALECRLQGSCAEGSHTCGIEGAEGVDAGWAAARLINLACAWEGELRATLGALGLRRTHHLRDAVDRVCFDADSDVVAALSGLRRLDRIDQALVQLLGR